MRYDAETLYGMLPAIYRIRDSERGEQLRALLSVIAEQVAVIEEDLEQLYDDQFIETCAEWVVPYIGDLIGYQALHGVVPAVSSPRAEVAHRIGALRRKGTASMLEQLARDVTGWPARVVEFFQLLATTQHMNHVRLGNKFTPDLREWEPLELVNTAFDSLAHTVDVRSISKGRGRYNIPNVGIFLWRIQSYALTESPAFEVDKEGTLSLRYLFSPLGNDTQLFNRAQSEEEITHIAEQINLPLPISRRMLDKYRKLYYGSDKSIVIWNGNTQIEAGKIVACDLSDTPDGQWAHEAPEGQVAIDPVLGRIAFSDSFAPVDNVRVTYHYGFSADMGGGSYEHRASFLATIDDDNKVPADELRDALGAVGEKPGVEITDSGRCDHEEGLFIEVASDKSFELRAANGHRPTLVPRGTESQPKFRIEGESGSAVILNGLLIVGAPISVEGNLGSLTLRHCTLVPGLSLQRDGNPEHPTEPSLIVESNGTVVEIDRCIIGGLRVKRDTRVKITNSIVDATDKSNVAYAGLDREPGGIIVIENSTIIGKVHTVLMKMASNTIFLSELADQDTWKAPVISDRRQAGCVRYSYLPLESLVPQRHRCRPANSDEARRVIPHFTSLRYGRAAYCQLSRSCAKEILQGADDESEMGAFHDLYQPQRETNLRVRLEEYLGFGLEAGILDASSQPMQEGSHERRFQPTNV